VRLPSLGGRAQTAGALENHNGTAPKIVHTCRLPATRQPATLSTFRYLPAPVYSFHLLVIFLVQFSVAVCWAALLGPMHRFRGRGNRDSGGVNHVSEGNTAFRSEFRPEVTTPQVCPVTIGMLLFRRTRAAKVFPTTRRRRIAEPDGSAHGGSIFVVSSRVRKTSFPKARSKTEPTGKQSERTGCYRFARRPACPLLSLQRAAWQPFKVPQTVQYWTVVGSARL
jgi:hypothetical protein